MASFKNILPDKRRTAVLGGLIALLVIFLVPYFFVFIPANADNLKRQAFLKLSRAAENIIEKSDDSRNFYENNLSGCDTLSASDISMAECSNYGRNRLSQQDSVYFSFFGSRGWNILYMQKQVIKKGVKKNMDDSSLFHILPLDPFLSPCLASGKEVFSSFLLVHYCQYIGKDSGGKIIYQDYRQGVQQEITLDSLIPRHQGMRAPDILDVTLEGTDYKLFSYPFQLGRHRLVLCGLMKTEDYNSRLHVIPVGIFYTLVICLFLFLLALPFLKIFMMNERDRLYASNLVHGVVFLFIMASSLTIIITQLNLLWQGRSQVSTNISRLTTKIEDSLSEELIKAQSELNYFDSAMDIYLNSPNPKAIIGSDTDSPTCQITRDNSYHNKGFGNKNRLLSGHLPRYRNYDHCSWISCSGQESIRAKYITEKTRGILKDKKLEDTTRFVDVRARQYYQDMKRNWQSGKNTDSTTLMIAPVNSWATGEFRVNVCRYSKISGLLLVLMETRLYSLVNTVLPAGYGYCVFDEAGNTLIHSDSLKSLRENFLDETGRLPWILGAIRGRQDIENSNVSFYGGSYTLHIQPLKQNRLFLAVFYNNQYLEPANLRILTFTFFFCILNYILLYLLFRILYSREKETLLYSPMDYYSRMIPRREKLSLYFDGSFFLFIYIVLFAAAAVRSPDMGVDVDLSMFVFALLTPFNLIYGLWLFRNKTEDFTIGKSILLILPLLATGALIYLLSVAAKWELDVPSFRTMELVFALILFVILIKKGSGWMKMRYAMLYPARKISGWTKMTTEQKKLFSYSIFITLFIFAIAVLPVLEYTWFAYNHELRQSLKKEQLEMASGIHSREKIIRTFLKNNKPDFTGRDSFADEILYTKGIYPLFGDQFKFLPRTSTSKERRDFSHRIEKKGDHESHSESFYLRTADAINFYYKDPDNLPPLNDSSTNDNLWHWDLGKDTSEFDYARPKWNIPPLVTDSTINPEVSLKIFSDTPKGLQLDVKLQLAFAVMLALLLLAIYWITKTIARRVYLTRLIGNAGTGLYEPVVYDTPEIWTVCFNTNANRPSVQKTSPSAAELIILLSSEYEEFVRTGSADPVSIEKKFIIRSQDLTPVFDCIWKTLDDKSKYLLYCLANDGLINNRNGSLIYTLLNKKLLVIYDQRIRLISYSFRDFIISRNNTRAEKVLLARMQAEASWTFIRTILLVIIMSVFVFLFLTQQEVSAKIIGLVTSLSALLPFILKFGSGTAAPVSKK